MRPSQFYNIRPHQWRGREEERKNTCEPVFSITKKMTAATI
jgi:hypothetical protein